MADGKSVTVNPQQESEEEVKTAEQRLSELETYNQVNDQPMLCLSPRAVLKALQDAESETRHDLEARVKELTKLNESLALYLDMCSRCLHDMATGKGGWAWEEVYTEAQTLSSESLKK